MLSARVFRPVTASIVRGLSSSGAGLSFELTAEQHAFKELARSFARDEVIPVAAKYDKSMAFPHDVFQKAWELGKYVISATKLWTIFNRNTVSLKGLVNAHIPTEYGGLGLHTVCISLGLLMMSFLCLNFNAIALLWY